MKLRYLSIGILLLLLTESVALAQVYRPKQQWMQMSTPHFRILYSEGNDSLARATGRILESQYGLTSRLTGGNLKRFPVILNDYNDRSNGYVSPLLFRTEVEVAPIKGKSMSPRTGGWLETVLPHELVHAQHMNVLPAPGLSWAFSLLSPDIGRGLNTFAHSGFLEGIAVYHESTVGVDGGRGNLSTFNYEFDTNWRNEGHSKRWGLGTSLSPTGSSHPGSRHYMGGYQYSKWLVDTYGEKSVRDIIDFHSRWPFLGFGMANWAKTGDSPFKMKSSFNTWYDSTRVRHTNQRNDLEIGVTGSGWKGARMRRPVWMDTETILFHASAYNETAGFFKFQTRARNINKLLKTSTVEDFIYTYDPILNELLYSIYKPHPYHENRYTSHLVRHSLEGGVGERVSGSDRIHAPSISNGVIDALGYHRESSVWMRFTGGEWDSVLTLHPDLIVQMLPRPMSDEYAVIANRNGLQAVWFVKRGAEASIKTSLPDIRYVRGSVLDASWSNDGSRLLYTVDMGGGVQLHEFDANTAVVTHLDAGRPILMEPSISPDGKNIAYVYPFGDEYLIGILPYDAFLRSEVPVDFWRADVTAQLERERLGSHLLEVSHEWQTKPYRGGLEWLKPRMVSPYAVEEEGILDTRLGVTLQSTELLRKHTYTVDISTSNNRVWYDLQYRYSGMYPGFIISTGSEPLLGFLNTGSAIVPTIIDDRNTRVSLPFRWVLKQNVATSLIQFRPEIQFRSIKAIDSSSGESLSESRSVQTLRGYLAIGLELEQAIRDLQPRRGAVIFADARHDLNTYLTEKGRGLRVGTDVYIPVMSSRNNGLQMRAQVHTQAGGLFYGSSSLHRNQFDDIPFEGYRHVANLQFRYAIPLIYPDKGGFFIPWYVERSWLVMFSNTIGPLGEGVSFDPIRNSRTSYGVEWRFLTGFPNFRINIGVGVAFEPTRRKSVYFVQ